MDIPQSDSIAGFLYASQNPAKLIGWICMKFTLPTGKEAGFAGANQKSHYY